MAIAVTHVRIRKHMPVALAVDGIHLDQALARLAAIGAGIHARRTADAAGNAVVEMEAANAVIHRHRGDVLVGQMRRPHAVFTGELDPAESLGRKAQNDAGNAAVADQDVRADADDGQRHVLPAATSGRL
jgi:hypothetical protein